MNKARRKAIEEIIDQIGTLKEQLESITEEEQEAFDNLPESIQYSERGDAMGEGITDLEQASSDLEDIMTNLQDIIER
jgi:predicted PurR-regulated permease PerM